jgi:hypothetical protein
MHTNPVVIFDETQLAEAIYKDVYLRTDRADYVSHVSCVMKRISASTLPGCQGQPGYPKPTRLSKFGIGNKTLARRFSPGTKVL